MSVRFTQEEEILTLDRLAGTELFIGKQLPETYRKFLLDHNGGSPVPNAVRYQDEDGKWRLTTVAYFLAIYDGEDENFLDFYETFRARVPADTIPIARDPGGNLFLLGTHGENEGKVFFWIKDIEVEEGEISDCRNVYFIADDIAQLLGSLHKP